MKIYIDLHDWWVGLYNGPAHRYVIVIPTIVIKSRRMHAMRTGHPAVCWHCNTELEQRPRYAWCKRCRSAHVCACKFTRAPYPWLRQKIRNRRARG